VGTFAAHFGAFMPTILQNHYVLAVPDAKASAAFFVEALGFRVVAEPPGWVFVGKDNCVVMLGTCPDDVHPSKLGCHSYFAYLRVDDADAYRAQLGAKGLCTVGLIEDKPWGMREFPVATPDGHRIMIGQVIP
jgi:catechol 2,3-dioxygenase-like lactoylglutathione lyase family enzyme